MHNTHNHLQITLLGQNIDAWGRDLTPKQKFSDLLRAVGEVEGIERVRFVTRCAAVAAVAADPGVGTYSCG